MKHILTASLLVLGSAAWADCPPATLADMGGLEPGAFPQQYDLSAFEALAGCEMTFQENPAIAELNARIQGNPAPLAPVAERLPDEPLVVVPYESIGRYGGTFSGTSNATEAGTSDLMSVRHVNIARYADDLTTIVPNIAKGWEWNDDFTELTIMLRPGHKWSDGAPFTAHDITFFYDHIVQDPNIIESPRTVWKVGDAFYDVEALDDTTVVFRSPAPRPGLLATLAADYAQPFQPRHFLGRFHPAIDENADANAQALGFETGYEVIAHYYGGSDWKDVPSPLLRDPATVGDLPKAVLPTLEAFLTVEDTTEGRRLVANPYFHMVDTAGNQLPYISEIDERYVQDKEVLLLRMVNGEIHYKSQFISLPDAPTLLDGAEAGDYTVDLRPVIRMPVITFNLDAPDQARAALFAERDFRLAMSHAIDRDEINSVAFFDLGTPQQHVHFSPAPPFVTEEQLNFAIAYDPELSGTLLDGIGLVDSDGDGVRELNGEPFTLNIQFGTQGVPTTMVELVAQNFTDVGIPTTIREVTSDEYRAAQAANELDVHFWTRGEPVPILLGSSGEFRPPYGSYFRLRNGQEWGRYIDTGGAEGIEPPEWTTRLHDTVLEWQTHLPGTPRSDALGTAIVDQLHESFLFIGTVMSPSPIYHSNALQNFVPPQTSSFEYYRIYPYRPAQWWLDG